MLHDTIDLKANKKAFWLVNGLSLLVFGLFILIGWFIVNPIDAIYETAGDIFVPVFVLLGGLVVYVVVHELTHGVFLSAFTKMKPKFGFVGWAAYCGNEGYCDKPRYAVVALAPLVFWGIVFGMLNVFFHEGIWFWVIWFLQAMNVGGSSGDLYVSCKLVKYPQEILVQDIGTRMQVYCRAAEKIAETDGGEGV
ncbi:MAG: DUF3267 domain-containing protein [Clostridia bacterium]|nr:DUF3267 domain-containing protein [Clostridia bacterium]